MHEYDIDGRYAQGWGGESPHGVHVNVLLARRGSATAAAITTAFTSPAPGFTPVLASIGNTQQDYETLNPPTVILNKSSPASPEHENLIFGASSVGIARGVLDAVAAKLLVSDQDTVILVSLWVDGAAVDETTVCINARTATVNAIREAVLGRSPDDISALVERRDSIRHPFYKGQ